MDFIKAPASDSPPTESAQRTALNAENSPASESTLSDQRALRGAGDDRQGADIPEGVVGEASAALGTTHTVNRRSLGARVVDGMVGQVNGQPIYTSTVFEPIVEQLSALGRGLPSSEFRLRARQLIEARLGQMIADALILGEAEGDLSAQEQAGLQHLLLQQRQELIRFWGQGSVAVAEENLVRQTSRGLDQTLTETRQRMLVQRYMSQKLMPQINVTRKDIERYYSDHADEYNPPPARTLRLIYVQDLEDAQAIDQMLAQGRAFRDVARFEINRYKPSEAGLMSEKAVGQEVFGQAPLNEAMLKLKAGDHSSRIEVDGKYWWIAVESIEQTPGSIIGRGAAGNRSVAATPAVPDVKPAVPPSVV